MASRLTKWSAVPVGSTRRLPGRIDLRSLFGFRPASEDSRRDLIVALNDVADAVSRALDLEELLSIIVENAKAATGAEKVMLALVGPHDDTLDFDTLVVRGARLQHKQDWWEELFRSEAPGIFQAGDLVVRQVLAHGAVLLAVPVSVRDHPIGVLGAINSIERPFSPIQLDFLSILAAFAAAAIENTRVAEHERYMALSGERNRIAREMHDGVVQSLFSVSLGLEVCRKTVFRDPVQTAVRLEDLQEHLNTSMSDLRRLVYDLRSMRLRELGLQRAIEFWIAEVSESPDAPDGRLNVEGALPMMSPQLEMCLYRVAKESVSNIVKHARATRFEVRLQGAPGRIAMTIEDNGVGFDAQHELEYEVSSGFGLRSIRERVEREGGHLVVESVLDRGTTTVVEFSGLGEP